MRRENFNSMLLILILLITGCAKKKSETNLFPLLAISEWVTNTDTSTDTGTDLGASCTDGIFGGNLSALETPYSFTFVAEQEKVIPGDATQLISGEYNCSGTIPANDQLGNLALVSQFYQNGCYTSGVYNHRDFPVRIGTVAYNGDTLDAFEITESTSKATGFLASIHLAYYKFPAIENYKIYRLETTGPELIAEIASENIINGGFTPVPNLNASAIVGTQTFIVAPSSILITPFPSLGTNVFGAKDTTNVIGNFYRLRYKLTTTPPDTSSGFNYGPGEWGNRYTQNRKFFPVRLGCVYGTAFQDTTTGKYIYISFGENLKTPIEIELPSVTDHTLAALTTNGVDRIYYFTIQSGDGTPNATRAAKLFTVDADGAIITSNDVDMSKSGFNTAYFRSNDTASMAYSQGKLGLIFGRIMHQSSDGLNHQGAIAAVFDAETLQQIAYHGQTSGHSFDNMIVANTDGTFLAIDLADNYPRGLHLHRFDEADINSRVIYTFKTKDSIRHPS